MTVTTNLIIWAIVMLPVALIAGAMFNARADADIQRRINVHNNKEYAREMAAIVSAILAKANLPGEPPPLTLTKFHTLMDMYDDFDLMPYDIPAQVVIDNDQVSAIYWKVININELDAYVIARLWLAGVL